MNKRHDLQALISRAELLALDGHGRSAVRLLKKVPIAKRTTEYWLALGRIQNFVGSRGVAEASARRALDLSPLSIYARADLIILLSLRRKFREALEIAQTAVEVFESILNKRRWRRLPAENDEINDLIKAIRELSAIRPQYTPVCDELLQRISARLPVCRV